MSRFSFVFLIILSIFSVGCAPKITTTMVVPAKSAEAGDLRSVAVLPIQGNYGSNITASVESVIASAEVNGVKYFTVADRQNLDKIMSEQKLQVSGVVDLDTVVEFGRLSGVVGIYTGTANYASKDSHYRETRSKCVSKDKDGKCLRYSEYPVNCVRRWLELVFIPKLIDVSTSRVRYTERITHAVEASRCSDSEYPIASAEELAKKAEVDVLNYFRYAIAPYAVKVRLSVMTDTYGITSKEGKELLSSGIDFAKAGRMDRACELWNQGRTQHPYSIAFAYNSGLCYEAKDQPSQALGLYNVADKLSVKPEAMINEALERIKNRISDQERLKKQL
jgi:hypothetical protein